MATPAQPLPNLFAQFQKFQAERKGKDAETNAAAAAALAGFLEDTPASPMPIATDDSLVAHQPADAADPAGQPSDPLGVDSSPSVAMKTSDTQIHIDATTPMEVSTVPTTPVAVADDAMQQ